MVTPKEDRSKIGDLDDEAMTRIALTTRRLLRERYGIVFSSWAEQHKKQAAALIRCTWLALREELERENV